MGLQNFCHFLLSLVSIYSLSYLFPTARDIFVKCFTFLAVVWMSEWLASSTRKYFLNKKVSSGKKAVLITGCDSGFGYALSQRLDSLGYKVFAACLDPLGIGATALASSCSSRLSILPLDVTNDQSIQSAKDYILKHLSDDVLWAVVNNAGIPQAGEIHWTQMEELQRVYEVNCLGTVKVTKAFLPLLIKSKGRLVNNTSACGHFICPGFVGYCMSKSAAIAFTTGLRIEMMKWKVKVISIEPFFYKTPLTQEQSAIDLIEKSWEKADPSVRLIYGENYKQNFLESTRKLLSRASPCVDEVIDCFEDAITSREPLSRYSPAYLPDKLGIKFLQALPSVMSDGYLRYQLAHGVKPLELTQSKQTDSKAAS